MLPERVWCAEVADLKYKALLLLEKAASPADAASKGLPLQHLCNMYLGRLTIRNAEQEHLLLLLSISRNPYSSWRGRGFDSHLFPPLLRISEMKDLRLCGGPPPSRKTPSLRVKQNVQRAFSAVGLVLATTIGSGLWRMETVELTLANVARVRSRH